MAAISTHLADIKALFKMAVQDEKVTVAEVIQIVGEVSRAVACVCDKLLESGNDAETAAEVKQWYLDFIVAKDIDIPGVPAVFEAWVWIQLGVMIEPMVLTLLAKLRAPAADDDAVMQCDGNEFVDCTFTDCDCDGKPCDTQEAA